jgi:hypothetical protein
MRLPTSTDTVVMVGVGIALVVYLGVGVGAVTATEGPLADAGLDQTVTAGDTVYLDAGGSTAPDGDIQSYEWEVEAPSGTTIEPECSTCAKTSFATNDSGKYTVSVTVTDDEGRSDTDTLYVTAEPYDPPEVTVNGPSTVTVGERRTVSMSVTASAEPMSSVLWHHNGDHQTSATLSADWSATHQVNISFAEPGIHEINATVVDDKGYQASDGATVRVVPPEPYLAVSITDINNTVQAGDTLVVTASVENTGEAQATQSMSLTRNGTGVDDTTVSLDSGARQTLRFAWQAAESDEGTYEFGVHSANESDAKHAMVEAASNNGDNDDQASDNGGLSNRGANFGEYTDLGKLNVGQLNAEIKNTGNGRVVNIQLNPPEDWPDSIDPAKIDPSKHNVVFETEDGETLEIRDDGSFPKQHSGNLKGEIKVRLNEKVQSVDHSRVEARKGETLSDKAEDIIKDRGRKKPGQRTDDESNTDGSTDEVSNSKQPGDSSFDILPGVVGPDNLGSGSTSETKTEQTTKSETPEAVEQSPGSSPSPSTGGSSTVPGGGPLATW